MMMSEAPPSINPLESLEIKLLLEAIFQRFGDDFRGHHIDWLRPRLREFMQLHEVVTVSELQNLILHHPGYIDALLNNLDAREPVLFDPPKSQLHWRELLVPWLRSCPDPKIWIADCVAPEDVFGVAILLSEENLTDKAHLYATSRSASLLEKTRSGYFPQARFARYQENYVLAGGTGSLKKYVHQVDGETAFSPSLVEHVTWAEYDLATDASFNEFEAIICAGGLAQYATPLRRRALQLFSDSLPVFGLLSLPGATTVKPAEAAVHFDIVSAQQGIYRKIR
jgi:chemotaxis protein methyltransferase CheR